MTAMRAVQPLLEEAEAQAGAMRGREWDRLLPRCPQVAEGFRRALEREETRAARAAVPPPPPGTVGPEVEFIRRVRRRTVGTQAPPAIRRPVGRQAPGSLAGRGPSPPAGPVREEAQAAAPPPVVSAPPSG